MRIGTWNLERLRRGVRYSDAYDTALAAMEVDLLIVTEPGPGFRERHPGAHLSPEERPNSVGEEAWVAILGSSLETVSLDINYRHLAVASRTVSDGTNVVVYGSILPWLSARTQAPDVYGSSGRPFIEVFETALREQAEDMTELRRRYPDDALVWAGDFNHPLMGHPLSREASTQLKSAIDSLGLKATNADAAHPKAGMNALDLICVEQGWTCTGVETDFPMFGGCALSDHCSYVSEVSA